MPFQTYNMAYSVFVYIKVGKIDRSNDIQKIAKPPISPSSNSLPQNWQKALTLVLA